MEVVGLSCVRDVAGSIETAVRHHLATVCDRIVLVDQGSTDGTAGIVEAIAREGLAVSVRRATGAQDAASVLTELAREAHDDGADWVVPFDGTELWADRTGQALRPVLSSSALGDLRAAVVTFAQDRSVAETTIETLPLAVWSVPADEPTTRSIIRPTAEVTIGADRSVTGARGRSEVSGWLVSMQLPLPARSAASSEEQWLAASVAGGLLDTPAGPVKARSDVRWATAAWRVQAGRA